MSVPAEALGAGPRADFMCNSKKCRTEDGAAPVYELPTKAVRCPVCSSKRLVRLYNSVNVSKSGFYAVNRLVDREGAQRMEEYHDLRDAAIRQQKRGGSTFAVPIGQNGVIGPGINQRIPGLFPGLSISGGRPGQHVAGQADEHTSGVPMEMSGLVKKSLGKPTSIYARDERQVLKEKLPDGRDRIVIQGEG